MLNSAKYLLILAFTFSLSYQAEAQEMASYAIQSDSKLWVDGTSNRSDWTVTANEMSGFIVKAADGTAEDPGIKETEFVVTSAKIVSNKSSIMDRLMKKALNVMQFPEISYKMTSAEVESSTDTGYVLKTTGDLSLVGVTKEITMNVEGEEQEDGKVRLQGSYTLLMSDYDIERPTAMYGSLRTGDEVVVNFDLYIAKDAAQQ